MNPAPVVGSPNGRPVAPCQTAACPIQGAGCCASCPNRQVDVQPQLPPPMPPIMPAPMPAPQPYYPAPQPQFYPQPQPQYYPAPQPQNALQPVMDQVNKDSQSWWLTWIKRGPLFVLIFIAYYYAIEYFSGRWDPFKKNPAAPSAVVSNTTYTTSNGYVVQGYAPTPQPTTGLPGAINATTVTTTPTYDDGNYVYRVDHTLRKVIVGLLPLNTESRSAISQWELQGYLVEPFRRTGTSLTGSVPISQPTNSSLKSTLSDLKKLAEDLRSDWNREWKGRFYNNEREDVERRINDLNSKVDLALGLATQESRQ